MDIQIINKPLQLNIYGFGDIVPGKDYVATLFKLSGKMWDIVKENAIINKGNNIWIYDAADKVFAGVELNNPTDANFGLEKLSLDIVKYAYFKHIGAYNLIKETGRKISDELTKKGYEIILPYIEIYGHWNKDESKLETELIMSLK